MASNGSGSSASGIGPGVGIGLGHGHGHGGVAAFHSGVMTGAAASAGMNSGGGGQYSGPARPGMSAASAPRGPMIKMGVYDGRFGPVSGSKYPLNANLDEYVQLCATLLGTFPQLTEFRVLLKDDGKVLVGGPLNIQEHEATDLEPVDNRVIRQYIDRCGFDAKSPVPTSIAHLGIGDTKLCFVQYVHMQLSERHKIYRRYHATRDEMWLGEFSVVELTEREDPAVCPHEISLDEYRDSPQTAVHGAIREHVRKCLQKPNDPRPDDGWQARHGLYSKAVQMFQSPDMISRDDQKMYECHPHWMEQAKWYRPASPPGPNGLGVLPFYDTPIDRFEEFIDDRGRTIFFRHVSGKGPPSESEIQTLRNRVKMMAERYSRFNYDTFPFLRFEWWTYMECLACLLTPPYPRHSGPNAYRHFNYEAQRLCFHIRTNALIFLALEDPEESEKRKKTIPARPTPAKKATPAPKAASAKKAMAAPKIEAAANELDMLLSDSSSQEGKDQATGGDFMSTSGQGSAYVIDSTSVRMSRSTVPMLVIKPESKGEQHFISYLKNTPECNVYVEQHGLPRALSATTTVFVFENAWQFLLMLSAQMKVPFDRLMEKEKFKVPKSTEATVNFAKQARTAFAARAMVRSGPQAASMSRSSPTSSTLPPPNSPAHSLHVNTNNHPAASAPTLFERGHGHDDE